MVCGVMAYTWIDADSDRGEAVYRFAGQASPEPSVLTVLLRATAETSVPEFTVEGVAGASISIHPREGSAESAVRISVPSAGAESQQILSLKPSVPCEIPVCRIELRRTHCKIRLPFLDRELPAETTASLLWYGCNRFEELVCLKSFSGMSDSLVLLFHPRLREPERVPETVGKIPPNIISRAWGTPLLVKTDSRGKVREESERYRIFLQDRQHPFMSRIEDELAIRPADTTETVQVRPTIIGNFLGGDMLRAESLEDVVKSNFGISECRKILDRLFSTVATWYQGSAVLPLKEWPKVFGSAAPLKLFGKYDLTTKEGREDYKRGMEWESDFINRAHLFGYLCGKNQDGFLYKLMEIPVRFSLVHGDLHPRNVLTDRHHIWLIDFGETGTAPTLFDFAKLEVFLRLWCLDPQPKVRNFQGAAYEFEDALLDQFISGAGGLGPISQLASRLGLEEGLLEKLAQLILHIRNCAASYCLGTPDRRDYLAVLFLTLLQTFRFAGKEREREYSIRYNFLLGLFWRVEDLLSRIIGFPPFVRERTQMNYKQLLKGNWLLEPRAPERVQYWVERDDGRTALEPLAATRGVIQSNMHHLDVFDHTLLALAYVESLLKDPLQYLADPDALDRDTRQAMIHQGFHFPFVERFVKKRDGESIHVPHRQEIQDAFNRFDDDCRIVLKWAMAFHDVGKPMTRSAAATPRGPVIQFRGHESCSVTLARPYLQQAFSEHLRKRIEWIISSHLKPLQPVTEWAAMDSVSLKAVFDSPDTEIGASMTELIGHPDFPLLALHCFADTLAARGPDNRMDLARLGEVYLNLLSLYVTAPESAREKESDRRFKTLTKGIVQELEVKDDYAAVFMKKLRQWYREHADRAAISKEDISQKATEIWKSLRAPKQTTE